MTHFSAVEKLPNGKIFSELSENFVQNYRSVIFGFSPPSTTRTKKRRLRRLSFFKHASAYFSSSAFKRFTNAAGSAICAPSASSA